MCGRYNTAGSRSAFSRKGFSEGQTGWYRRPKYNVPINIADKEGSFEVTVYAIGFDKENIRLTVVDDILYISGTRAIEEGNEPNFTKQEFPVKSFERMIALNRQIDTAKITARQENGILIINMPKTPEAQQPEQEIKVD